MEDEFRKMVQSKIRHLEFLNLTAKDDLSENVANCDSSELDEIVRTIDCTKYAVEVLQSILRE